MRRSSCNRLPGVRFHALPANAIVPSFIDSALIKPRASLQGQTATRQMADDMRQAGHREGGVTRDDLSRMGWTPLQIDTHAAAANIQAQAMSGLTW